MRLHLVRHLPVAAHLSGVCYGRSDVPHGDDLPAERDLASRLRALRPDAVVTSGLSRCLRLAMLTADAPRIDPSWQERDFGDWELQRWDYIHAADPAIIDRLAEPGFAPPHGESLVTIMTRVQAALADLPKVETCLVISHGGPIALARATLAGAGLDGIAKLIPAPGEVVEVWLCS